MRRIFNPVDAVLVSFYCILTLIVAMCWPKMERPWVFVGLHALCVLGVVGLALMHVWFDNRWSRLLHAWMPVLFVLAIFRELHFLVPQVHDFSDRRYDRILDAIDLRLFGDVAGWCRANAHPLAAEIFTVCYMLYFALPFVLGGYLYARREMARFQRVATALIVGWLLSYLGYIAVPAVGPLHVVDGPRSPELAGYGLAGLEHQLVLTLELEMPDAFPSGHALVAMLAVVLAAMHARKIFWLLLPVGIGIVVGTVYLRYHYVVDVVVSALLVPVAILIERAITPLWNVVNDPPVRIRDREPADVMSRS